MAKSSASSDATRAPSPDALDASRKSRTHSADEASAAATAESSTPAPAKAKAAPGARWKDAEVQQIVHNRLVIVMPALAACVFLAAMDQTIIAVAIPDILQDLGPGSGSGYSWIGTAYLLGAAAFASLYGRLADIVGRRLTLFATVVVFLIGSALCGAAQNIIWLCVCRAVQGIGGGGIIQLVQITISDLVSLKDRGKYAGIIGMTFASLSSLPRG